MGYSVYPEYKATELGVTHPKGWSFERLRFSVMSNPVKSEVSNWKDDTLVSFIPMEAVGEYGGIDLSKEKAIGDVYGGYTYFANGDIVIAKITPCFENGKGAIVHNLTSGVAFGTTEFHVVRPLKGISQRWIFYLTMSHDFRNVGASEMVGAGGQKRVPETYIKDFRTGIPSPSEQQKIADFLDWKTEQIDALIAKKKLLIEKLKEKRIALITHAVTKGLNPNAKMKDSGIPWLGEVPEHWEVKPVKFLTRILRGQFSHRPRNDLAYYDGEYPFVQTGDIARANKYVSIYSQTLNDLGLSVSKQFPAGTLVMTIAANIGDMAIIKFKACFPDSIVGFVPESNIDLQFLYYMFVAMKQRLLMTAVLNTQLNLNIDRIGSIATIEPPLGVQKQIVDFLDKHTKQIDALITKNQQLIEKLTEYRTALITAATTGKIDVRGEGEGGVI